MCEDGDVLIDDIHSLALGEAVLLLRLAPILPGCGGRDGGAGQGSGSGEEYELHGEIICVWRWDHGLLRCLKDGSDGC